MATDTEWHATPLDQELMDLLEATGAKDVKIFRKEVRDGELKAIVSCEPPDYKWKLVLIHAPKRRHRERFPTWEELTEARYDLLPAKLTMALYLGPLEEGTAVRQDTLHLHESKGLGLD